jgi:peptidoglycan-associated lipoprotein
MKKAFSLLLIFSLFVGLGSTFAQSKTYKKALEVYQSARYFEAADLLKAAYQEENSRQVKTEINFQLGECYRNMGNYIEAESYYSRGITMRYPEPIIYYYLAQMLKAQGKYDEAINEYNNFRVQSPSDRRADAGIESCNIAKQWQDMRSRYLTENMTAINSKWNDFNPAITKRTGGQMVFTSSREESMGKEIDGWTGESFTDIFYTEQDRKSLRDKSLTPVWSTPTPLSESINSDANEGGLTMNAKANTMYFSVCEDKKDRSLGCSIYKSRKQGPNWAIKELLDIAGDSVLICQPTLSLDEKTIYFVSDMEGGYGGSDLYSAAYDRRKRGFANPVNMGPEINSEGNEMYPHLAKDGKMYFASNGHVGMGGLDIFYSENRDGVWLKPQNMMPPINSSADDLSLIWEDEKCQTGFFASDREDGMGGDDIYRVYTKAFEITITGIVSDAKTGAVIQQTEVTLTGSNGKSFIEYTNALGVYEFSPKRIQEGVNYSLSFKKEGYLNKSVSTTTVGIPLTAYEEIEEGYAYTINLSKEIDPIRKPIDLPTIEFDLASADLRLDAKDALDFLLETLDDNPEIVIELRAHTDYRGTDASNLDLSQRRAESCVEYLLGKGVDSLRMVAKGMGETEPYVLEKPVAPFKASDVMTQTFIDQLKTNDHKEMAHQMNRRVDFKVLSTDYKPFGKGFNQVQDTEIQDSSIIVPSEVKLQENEGKDN